MNLPMCRDKIYLKYIGEDSWAFQDNFATNLKTSLSMSIEDWSICPLDTYKIGQQAERKGKFTAF